MFLPQYPNISPLTQAGRTLATPPLTASPPSPGPFPSWELRIAAEWVVMGKYFLAALLGRGQQETRQGWRCRDGRLEPRGVLFEDSHEALGCRREAACLGGSSELD